MSAFGGPHGLGLGARPAGRGRGGGIGGAMPEPPALLDPGRERDGRRIARMFRPYRGRLLAVVALIVLSSGLSTISPFLLRAVLDRGILRHQTTLLTELVLAMIGIAVATAAIGVVQTYISNE